MEAHCKTMATKTRAELIALLKSRGIKGRLSKMTKAQLLAKVKATAPAGAHPGGGQAPRP